MKIIITLTFLILFSLSLTAEEKNKCMDMDKLSKEFFECTKNGENENSFWNCSNWKSFSK